MTKKKKNPLNIPEKELKAIKKVKEYKLICESNVVSILWKDTDLFFNYDNLDLKDFTHNEWKVYFQIGKDIIIKEKKQTLDEVTVNLYLEKHEKLKEKYIEYGGYETIDLAKGYVKEKNIDGYIEELNKWNIVINLVKNKFPIADRLSEYVDMTSEEIYDEYEAILNHVFINSSNSGCKTSYLADGIHELIEDLDEGYAVGLPLYNMPILTHEIGGLSCGNITLMGGLSGTGKTTLTRYMLLPSILFNEDKICIMVNEEGKKKWQREMLIWVINNVFNENAQKYKLRDGGFTKEFKELLHRAGDWLLERKEQLIFADFENYSTNGVIKCLKKYAHLGVSQFILDTLKPDSGTSADNTWFDLMQNMSRVYDTIKESALNVSLTCTFQLAKSSSRQRCYTQDNIGVSKNIIDTASTCIMIRKLFEDEFEGEKHELKVFKKAGKNGNTTIPVKLDKTKHYQLLFVVKNREGSCNDYAIVIEHDMSRNTVSEIGFTVVPVDF